MIEGFTIEDVLAGRADWVVVHGDALAVLPVDWRCAWACDGPAVLVTDPPYGIAVETSKRKADGGIIVGDHSTEVRDAVLARFPGVPALVFGSPKAEKPAGTRMTLVWSKGAHVGMGDLDLPWKPTHEEIYVIGSGFRGYRGESVIDEPALYPNLPGANKNRGEALEHPTQKPWRLMYRLIQACPDGVVIDPFCGSGSTGVAAVKAGRRFIGVECELGWVDIARRRIREAGPALFRAPPHEQLTF